MKWGAVLALSLIAVQASAQPSTSARSQGPESWSDRERDSYAVGVEMGRGLKRQGADVDVDRLLLGLKEAMSGAKLRMADLQLRDCLSRFLSQQKLKQLGMAREQAPENLKKGEAFLAANRTKPGVVTLPDGLQYKVLKMGDGKKPTDADTVTIHYRGSRIDGTEFVNTYARQKPVDIGVKGVMPGWSEALKLMPVGSKWQVFIPSRLAYGVRGVRSVIGPNETLILEIELLDVK